MKKWVIRKREAIPEAMPSTSSALGRVEVFDDTMVSGPTCSDMLAYRLLLMSRFSTITSITQSISESFSKSSSMFPALMSLALRLCVSISGFDLAICSIADLAMALRSLPSLTMSRSRTSQPALAQ